VTGTGEGAGAGGGVAHAVQAGGQDRVVEFLQGVVEVVQELGGGQVQAGEGTHGGAPLSHDGGGRDAVAHDVADDQGRLAGGDLDDVVPVSADLVDVAAGLVAMGDLDAVRWVGVAGQQAALKSEVVSCSRW
jgi:hypothetical protein